MKYKHYLCLVQNTLDDRVIIKKIKNMTVVESVNSFFAKYEESNFDLCNGIVQSFINTCKQLNPNINHMDVS